MSETAAPAKGKSLKELDRAVVRFAGDSGEGRQLPGEQFTTEPAWAGNDIAPLPNSPAEIRAPAGTLFGVSSFQLQFGSQRVYTPGDRLDCLVAMNPAALKVHLRDLKPGGLLLVNTAAFDKRNLDKAGYAQNPLDDPALAERYRLYKGDMTPGLYRAMTGNRALAWGLLAAAQRSKIPLVYGAYPITPASGILEELAMHKRFRIRTIQAEDEIAAVTAAIGASFGGAIGVTASSGPGIALKGEGIGLAVTAELPLVIFDIQRGGPSTRLPTKTEQADLMQALYGRNSESPVVVLAPATPGDCFYIAYAAVRVATKYMVPVMVLSDGFLANVSEPWLLPDPETVPPVEIGFPT